MNVYLGQAGLTENVNPLSILHFSSVKEAF